MYIDHLNSPSVDILVVGFVDVFINTCMNVDSIPRVIKAFGSKMIINQVTKRKQKTNM